MKVSVVVSVYNETYLKECLDSLINQTLEDIEIICVNDSADNSLNILEQYKVKDPRIKIVFYENKNLSSLWNTGLKCVTGEFVFFMDSYDWIREDGLEILYNKSTNYNLDVLSCSFSIYNNETSKNSTTHHSNSMGLDESLYGTVFNYKILDYKMFYMNHNVSNKLYNTDFLQKNNLKFSDNLNQSEDILFFYSVLLKAKRISAINEYLYFYRILEDSLINSEDKKSFDCIIILEKLIELFNKTNVNYYNDLIHYCIQIIRYNYEYLNDNYKNEFLKLISHFCSNFNNEKIDLKNFNHWIVENKYFYLVIKDSLDSDEELNYEKFQKNYLKYKNQKMSAVDKEVNLSHYKLSLIISTYNIEKYLNKTIDSLINQTIGFENIELILVDDNSSDSTQNIISSYSSKYENVKHIFLTENSGFPGKPRNKGIENSTAEYIMVMDHDDSYVEDALEILYNTISSENVDLAFCNYYRIYPDNTIVGNLALGDVGTIKVNDISEYPMLLNLAATVWTKIFRKEFIDKYGIRFLEGMLAEDVYVVGKSLLNANGIVYLNDYCGYNYKIRNNDEDKSTVHLATKRYLNGTINGFNQISTLFDSTEDENNYFELLLQPNLRFWLETLCNSDTNSQEKKELLTNSIPIYLKAFEHNVEFEENINSLYHLIINKDVEAALLECNRLSDLNNNHMYQEIIDQQKKEITLLKTTKGWFKYKINNIILRLKNKLKN